MKIAPRMMAKRLAGELGRTARSMWSAIKAAWDKLRSGGGGGPGGPVR